MINNVHDSCFDALKAVLGQIPSQKFVMLILDLEDISENTVERITEVYNSMKRPDPLMFKGIPNSLKKLWLCDPKSRKNDMCITEMQHRCNGIETEILTYVLPGPCPNCDVSSEDPVIASRATSMQIIAKYKKSSCRHCEWEDEETEQKHKRRSNTISAASSFEWRPSLLRSKSESALISSFSKPFATTDSYGLVPSSIFEQKVTIAAMQSQLQNVNQPYLESGSKVGK